MKKFVATVALSFCSLSMAQHRQVCDTIQPLLPASTNMQPAPLPLVPSKLPATVNPVLTRWDIPMEKGTVVWWTAYCVDSDHYTMAADPGTDALCALVEGEPVYWVVGTSKPKMVCKRRW